MYAIIADDGRQYKVSAGDELTVDYRDLLSVGDEVTFDRILAIGGDEGTKLGQPTVEGATVTASVVGVKQGPKLVVQKFRRRKNSRSKTGHRQLYTQVKINAINVS